MEYRKGWLFDVTGLRMRTATWWATFHEGFLMQGMLKDMDEEMAFSTKLLCTL
jgi:hypothetical protein